MRMAACGSVVYSPLGRGTELTLDHTAVSSGVSLWQLGVEQLVSD